MFKLCYIILMLPQMLFSQGKGQFGIEFNVNRTFPKMTNLSNYLGGPNFYPSSIPELQVYSSEYKNKPKLFKLSVSYQPFSFVDFGVAGSYQIQKQKNSLIFILFDGLINYDTITWKENFSVSSFGLELFTTIYLNDLLKFENKNKFVANSVIALELASGFGNSKYTRSREDSGLNDNLKTYSSLYDYQGSISLKLGYKFLNNKTIISSFGIKAGYQYYSTGLLKNSIGQTIFVNENQQEVNLDYSGILFGFYLKIAKK